MVSRERELASAADAFERIRAGPAALLIEGEPGIGKTTLWRAAVDAARERGFCVLEARPAEAEALLSHAALGDLLTPVLDPALAGLPPPQRRALEVALLLADPEGEPPDRRAIGIALLATLRGLAARAASSSRSTTCSGSTPTLRACSRSRCGGSPTSRCSRCSRGGPPPGRRSGCRPSTCGSSRSTRPRCTSCWPARSVSGSRVRC